jgi:lipoprotein-anchoring transpeptidase ErfK/SrfK
MGFLRLRDACSVGTTAWRLALLAVVLASTACSNSADPLTTATGSEPADDGSAQVEVIDDNVGESAGGPGAYTVVAHADVPLIEAREAPEEGAAVVADVANPLPSGSPLSFRVLPDGSESSAEWVEVMLPIQPNGSTGWIPRADVSLTDNPYRIEIDRASYSLRVYNLDELWIESTVAIGTGDTPTPVGDFYLLELLQPPEPDGPYGPYAFGLSGFSEVLDTFGDSDTAIIGLHGTNDPAALGTDVSFGCIRLENEVIEELAATLPLGTPVTIT